MWLWLSVRHQVRTHHPADASATGSCFKLAMQLLHRTRGVEAFRQQNDPIQEEEGRDPVDDILHQLYSGERKTRSREMTFTTTQREDVFSFWREEVRVSDVL